MHLKAKVIYNFLHPVDGIKVKLLNLTHHHKKKLERDQPFLFELEKKKNQNPFNHVEAFHGFDTIIQQLSNGNWLSINLCDWQRKCYWRQNSVMKLLHSINRRNNVRFLRRELCFKFRSLSRRWSNKSLRLLHSFYRWKATPPRENMLDFKHILRITSITLLCIYPGEWYLVFELEGWNLFVYTHKNMYFLELSHREKTFPYFAQDRSERDRIKRNKNEWKMVRP